MAYKGKRWNKQECKSEEGKGVEVMGYGTWDVEGVDVGWDKAGTRRQTDEDGGRGPGDGRTVDGGMNGVMMEKESCLFVLL